MAPNDKDSTSKDEKEEGREESTMTIQLTQEQFNELLRRRDPSPFVPGPSTSHKNFTKCTFRYNGERSYAKVEEFITSISIYKKIEQIPDDDALTGLPLLLTDNASAWWTGIRSEIKTWAAALSSVRSAFAPKRQPHDIYVELFSDTQGESEDIDSFVCRKRLLLGMLPAKRHKEEEQIDFVYGIMRLDLQKKIARSDVKTFSELLEKARNLETLAKKTKISSSTSIQEGKEIKKAIRCKFCYKIGHEIEVCRKRLGQLARKEKDQTYTEPSTSTAVTPKAESPIKCYGCGAPGVFRSQCTTCKKQNSPEKPIQFCAIDTKIQCHAKVPTIEIQFNGKLGHAHIDTAAKTSIAGSKLYAIMKKEGVEFGKKWLKYTWRTGQQNP